MSHLTQNISLWKQVFQGTGTYYMVTINSYINYKLHCLFWHKPYQFHIIQSIN